MGGGVGAEGMFACYWRWQWQIVSTGGRYKVDCAFVGGHSCGESLGKFAFLPAREERMSRLVFEVLDAWADKESALEWNLRDL